MFSGVFIQTVDVNTSSVEDKFDQIYQQFLLAAQKIWNPWVQRFSDFSVWKRRRHKHGGWSEVLNSVIHVTCNQCPAQETLPSGRLCHREASRSRLVKSGRCAGFKNELHAATHNSWEFPQHINHYTQREQHISHNERRRCEHFVIFQQSHQLIHLSLQHTSAWFVSLSGLTHLNRFISQSVSTYRREHFVLEKLSSL